MEKPSKDSGASHPKTSDIQGDVCSQRQRLNDFGLPKLVDGSPVTVKLNPIDLEAILLLSIKYSGPEIKALKLTGLFDNDYSAKDLLEAPKNLQNDYKIDIAEYLQNYIDACKTFSPHQVLSGMRSVIDINYEVK
ncbi:MAG: hypothetical protein ACC707_15100 [Thiohalomonadales bacterium]